MECEHSGMSGKPGGEITMPLAPCCEPSSGCHLILCLVTVRRSVMSVSCSERGNGPFLPLSPHTSGPAGFSACTQQYNWNARYRNDVEITDDPIASHMIIFLFCVRHQGKPQQYALIDKHDQSNDMQSKVT